MKFFWIIFILLISLFLETTFISLPIVLLSILMLGILFKEEWIFPLAFVMGMLLDILSFHTIGESSIFFILILGAIFLYQRKFEIQSIPFVVIFSFFTSIIYGLFFHEAYIFWEAIMLSFICGGIFFIIESAVNKNIATGRLS